MAAETRVVTTAQLSATTPRRTKAIPTARNQPQLRLSSSAPIKCQPWFVPVDMATPFWCMGLPRSLVAYGQGLLGGLPNCRRADRKHVQGHCIPNDGRSGHPDLDGG